MIVVVSSLLLVAIASVVALPFEVSDPTTTPTLETSEQTFRRADVDHDSALDFNEFLHTDLPYEQLKKREFDQLDVNHDGRITKREYEEHYRRENQNADDLRAEYIGQIFEDFDTNFDLKLDRDEIVELMRRRFFVTPRSNFDVRLPFHELDAIDKPTTTTPTPTSITAFDELRLPLMIEKQEKLPNLKPQLRARHR